MSTNRLTTALFGASLALALALIVSSHWFDGGVKRIGLATRGRTAALPGAGAAEFDAPPPSPFDSAAALDSETAADADSEAAPSRSNGAARRSVYEGPTYFDDADERLVTRLSDDRPETVRFSPRDVDHVERRDGGETVLVLRRGPSVLVTEELLAAAPDDLRERIAYEGPPVEEMTMTD